MHRLVATAVVGLSLASPAYASCDEPVDAGSFLSILADAEAAFGSLDVPAFDRHMDRGANALPCVDEPLSPSDAARYHRLQGLRAYLVRDEDRANEAFLAARRVEPTYRFPEAFVPADHAIRETYRQLPLDAFVPHALNTPAEGHLLLDGEQRLERPNGAPVVFQFVDGEGSVETTVYLWPDEPTPTYPAAPVKPATSRLPYAAIGGAALSAGLYGAGLQRRLVYDNPATEADRLPGLRKQTHGLGVASVAVGAVALGTGFTWVVRR